MDKDLEQGEVRAAEPEIAIDHAEEDPAETAPVVLADAMCGAFCSIKGETRLT